MIRQKDLFSGIVRVLGLKEVIFGLTTIPAFFMPDWSTLNNMWNSMFVQLISPAILLLIGIYLLTGGKALINIGYREEIEEEPLSARVIFILGMKTVGLYLMIKQIEALLFNINSWISMYGMFHNEITGPLPLAEYGVFWVVPYILLLFVLGFYLMKSGNIFIRIAFREKREQVEVGE